MVGERGMMLPGFCANVRVMRGSCSKEDLEGAGIALIGSTECPDVKLDKLLHFTSVKTFHAYSVSQFRNALVDINNTLVRTASATSENLPFISSIALTIRGSTIWCRKSVPLKQGGYSTLMIIDGLFSIMLAYDSNAYSAVNVNEIDAWTIKILAHQLLHKQHLFEPLYSRDKQDPTRTSSPGWREPWVGRDGAKQ